jgi:hypothetical protein
VPLHRLQDQSNTAVTQQKISRPDSSLAASAKQLSHDNPHHELGRVATMHCCTAAP